MPTKNDDVGGVNFSTGAALRKSTYNVSSTPTLAELTAAFPNMQAGEVAVVDDNGAGTASFVVWSTDGTTRFFAAGTLAS